MARRLFEGTPFLVVQKETKRTISWSDPKRRRPYLGPRHSPKLSYVPSNSIPSHPIPSHPIPSHPVPSRPVPSLRRFFKSVHVLLDVNLVYRKRDSSILPAAFGAFQPQTHTSKKKPDTWGLIDLPCPQMTMASFSRFTRPVGEKCRGLLDPPWLRLPPKNKSQQVKQSRAVGVAFAGQSMNMQAPSRSSFGPWAGWGGRFVLLFFLSRISDGQKMFLLGVGGKMNPFRRDF